MRSAAWLFWGITIFFAVTASLYTLWGYLSMGIIDWSGGTPFGLAAVLSALIAFFLTHSRRQQHGRELPEDRPEASIDEGDPEVGHFSPWSWWPFMIGASGFLVFLGFAVGIWLSFIGAGLAAVSLVGWVYEYYRGPFAR